MKEIDEAKKEEYERKMLIDSLEELPARVVAMAYLYALNYELYGVDVTEKWQTAADNTLRLEMAYMRGRSDGIQCDIKIKPPEATPKSPSEMVALFEPELVQLVMQPEPVQQTTRPEITHEQAVDYLRSTGWLQEHDRQMMLDGIRRYAEDPDLAAIKAAALQAGFDGKEVRFYIGGRLFAIRELPG